MALSLCRIVAFLQVGNAVRSNVLYNFVKIRPPEMVACQALDTKNSRISFVKSI